MTTGKVDERDAQLAYELISEHGGTDNIGLLRRKIAEALATVRQEVWREAILLLDTASLCHCAGKQYIDPVALVQRMNAALESAAKQER